MSRTLRYAIHSALVLGLFAVPLNAQVDPLVPFEPKDGEPAQISVFQEIPGFSDTLMKLDAHLGLIDHGSEWVSMSETDIWVFFMQDEAEANLLPGFVLESLSQHYDGSATFAMIGDVWVRDAKKERLMYFVFLDKFEDYDLAIVGCDTAILLFDRLKGSGVSDMRSLQSACFPN